jgi:endoglucanase
MAAVTVLALLAGPHRAAADETPYGPSPFEGRTLYVDPASDAARDAAALATIDAVSSAALHEIARRPQADWFGDWDPVERVTADVAARVAAIRAVGAYPVFVAYAIPQRDCASWSGGGAASPSAYLAWIDAFRAGIGGHPAAVILEPDALAQLGCLGPADRVTRLELLRAATRRLAAGGRVAVYLDAGHAGWIAPAEMAQRLIDAGVYWARGFALNVSNFGATADEVAYGRQIAPTIGWKRFVVDTSRNGLGPAASDEWCNPPGRALGATPTPRTGDRLVDAFLWIKRPGESDGSCNGGPPAGTWWRSYAIGLSQRAP